MRASIQKTIVLVISIVVGVISSKVEEDKDFLWSIRSILIPVLMTMLTLFITLSMNLVKALDELPEALREKSVVVLDSIKRELRIVLSFLLFTFSFVIILPLFISEGKNVIWGRCIVDGLLVLDIILFMIVILDTYFGYLDLIKNRK